MYQELLEKYMRIDKIIVICSLYVFAVVMICFPTSVCFGEESRTDQEMITVTVCDASGNESYSCQVQKGSAFRIPGMEEPQGYTLLGWSDTPGKTSDPEYQVDETIVFEEDISLFPVYFNVQNEISLTRDQIVPLDTVRYSRLIFVGDSRTDLMKSTMENQFGSSVFENISFVAKRGGMLSWLRAVGYPELLRNLEMLGDGTEEQPVAIVFHMGINDPANLYNYISFMKKIAPQLQKHHCRLFFMSLNPINLKMIQAYGMVDRHRSESAVRTFNSKMCVLLGDEYYYIDTYSRLIKTGFGFDNNGMDDGLHYTANTYKRIYNYAVHDVNTM